VADALFDDDIGTLLDTGASKQPLVTDGKIDILARLLAGFRYPGRKKYEALTAAQRTACREAAELALTHLQNKPD